MTLHAILWLKDLSVNREFFFCSRCVNFKFHAVKIYFHTVFTPGVENFTAGVTSF